MRGQHELDRQIEKRTEPLYHVLAGHGLATSELNVEPFAEIGEGVARDDRV